MTKPPDILFYHREYHDPSLTTVGERYLQYLRYIYTTGVRHYNTVRVTDKYTALLRLNGQHLHVIMLPGGEVYFEFQTSGSPLAYWNYTQGGISGKSYMVGVIGVTVKNGTLTPVLLGGKRVQVASSASRIKRNNQVQLVDEPVHYYTAPTTQTTYGRQLYESWAPLHPHTGVHFRTYHTLMELFSMHMLGGSYTAHYTRDVGYDALWGDNTKLSPMREAVVTSADWPRQSGIQTVVDNTYGTREFAVYIDAFDQVTVFPTSQIVLPITVTGGVFDQNVDPKYVKTARVTFPSWVYRKSQTFKSWYAANSGSGSDIASGIYQFPELDWKLHPDGTKMCAVVYEHIQAQFDTAYYAPFATETSSQGPGTFFPDINSFNLMNAVTMGMATMGNGFGNVGDAYYQNAPGLIETTIEITLNGPAPEQFAVSITTAEIRRPTTTPYCTFAAGYVWYDIKSKTSTPANPQYDAQRGDLCVLDIEVYGRLTDGKAASLLSLKNLTAGGGEFKNFGGTTLYNPAATGAGTMYSGLSTVLAYDFRTLSFVFRYSNEVFTPITNGNNDRVTFGVVVYVMNRWQQTFLPTIMSATDKGFITDKVDTDFRAAMNAQFGAGMVLQPLNDLRDWTDPDLASLREHYVRSLSKSGATSDFGPYAGNPQPYANTNINNLGYKYWKTGSFATPTPSTSAQNWYNSVVRHGLYKPYGIYDLLLPRPGWWQYAGHIIQMLEIDPRSTTFFTHPNGSWAFFSNTYIYNANGVPLLPIGAGVPGTGASSWLVANTEHCIFDQIVLVDDKGASQVSSFRTLYNLAITNGQTAKTITDNSAIINLIDMKAQFTLGTIPDPNVPAVTYAQMRIDWAGFTAYYREMAYFSGIKTINVDPLTFGMAGNFSLSALWKETADDSAALSSPNTNTMPITFSTCVLITK